MSSSQSILNGGANRGARVAIRPWQEYIGRSQTPAFAITYVDPEPGRAKVTAEMAREAGIQADWVEGHVQEVMTRNSGLDHGAVVLNLDDPAQISDTLEEAGRIGIPVLLYVLVLISPERLMGLFGVYDGEDSSMVEDKALLFARLARLTAPGGADTVFRRSEHASAEALLRQMFAHHVTANVPRLLGNRRPRSASMTATMDGRAEMPLFVRNQRGDWTDPWLLARDIIADPPVPIVPSEDFMIAELGPNDGLRLHRARVRRTDGRLSVRQSSQLAPRPPETDRDVSVIDRLTLTRANPVRVTD